MLIDITTLPKTVQQQLPMSIRSFKNIYEFSDLPIRVQHIIKEYQDNLPDIVYNNAFDLIPEISEYSDFEVINNIVNLVTEYLKNYLVVLPGAYPFDPIFGCTLKYHLQTRDTELRETLIVAEVNRIINVIESLLNVSIVVNSIKSDPISMGSYTEFNVNVDLSINNVHKTINMEFS